VCEFSGGSGRLRDALRVRGGFSHTMGVFHRESIDPSTRGPQAVDGDTQQVPIVAETPRAGADQLGDTRWELSRVPSAAVAESRCL
jgi:hypothetical protein